MLLEPALKCYFMSRRSSEIVEVVPGPDSARSSGGTRSPPACLSKQSFLSWRCTALHRAYLKHLPPENCAQQQCVGLPPDASQAVAIRHSPLSPSSSYSPSTEPYLHWHACESDSAARCMLLATLRALRSADMSMR